MSGMPSSFRLDDGQSAGRMREVHYSTALSDRCPRAKPIRQSRLLFLPWSFKIRTMAIMVFQFRVVAGTPNSLSIWPR
jgi:hypothetical protein